MVVAHLADLHLGYRAYHRLAPGGQNAREQDVARAFELAVDRLIELAPSLVLVAGDVFHTVRPSNSAIATAFRQFARLHEGLPDTPIVVIAGNHDSPRAVETGSILRLFNEIPGVHLVDDVARPVHLPELDTTVLCLPHNALAGGGEIELAPDPAASINILMLHGTVTGGLVGDRLRYLTEYGGAQVDTSLIDPSRWDYIALGHYHIATELAPNMWYSGGTERTSTNIWEESEGPKGFLTYDMAVRRATFHPLPGREVVDLPGFSARLQVDDTTVGLPWDQSDEATDQGPGGEGAGDGAPAPLAARYLEPAEIDARIRELVEGIRGGLAGKIVRLVITDLPREVLRLLDHRQLREYRAEALHFHLDARRPEVRRLVGYGSSQRRLTLEEEVRSFLEGYWQRTSGEIKVSRLVELADRYLGGARGGEG